MCATGSRRLGGRPTGHGRARETRRERAERPHGGRPQRLSYRGRDHRGFPTYRSDVESTQSEDASPPEAGAFSDSSVDERRLRRGRHGASCCGRDFTASPQLPHRLCHWRRARVQTHQGLVGRQTHDEFAGRVSVAGRIAKSTPRARHNELVDRPQYPRTVDPPAITHPASVVRP